MPLNIARKNRKSICKRSASAIWSASALLIVASAFRRNNNPSLTFQHRAGVRPYTSSFDFAESCVFAKQSPGPLHCAPDCSGGPFLRTYGANLPSSLAMIHSSALGYSPRLPVSVYGTGCLYSLFLAANSLLRFAHRARLKVLFRQHLAAT